MVNLVNWGTNDVNPGSWQKQIKQEINISLKISDHVPGWEQPPQPSTWGFPWGGCSLNGGGTQTSRGTSFTVYHIRVITWSAVNRSDAITPTSARPLTQGILGCFMGVCLVERNRVKDPKTPPFCSLKHS